jgi:hypothetical protein
VEIEMEDGCQKIDHLFLGGSVVAVAVLAILIFSHRVRGFKIPFVSFSPFHRNELRWFVIIQTITILSVFVPTLIHAHVIELPFIDIVVNPEFYESFGAKFFWVLVAHFFWSFVLGFLAPSFWKESLIILTAWEFVECSGMYNKVMPLGPNCDLWPCNSYVDTAMNVTGLAAGVIVRAMLRR